MGRLTAKQRELWRWLPAAAAHVRREHSLPLVGQAVAFTRTALPWGFSPEEFYQFGWWRADERREREDYLSWRAFRRLDARLNPHPFRILTQHKYLTHLALAGAGVPEPRFHGVFHQQRGFHADGGTLRSPADLEALFSDPALQPVFKLAVGLQGRGFLAFGPSGDGAWRTVDGRVFDAQSLHAHLTAPADVEWIVQERVRHAPFFARYGPGGGKLRLVTLGGGEEPLLVAGMAGIAFGQEAAVNGQQGSMHAGVDLATGCLGSAHRRWVLPTSPGHPRLGLPIQGERLPAWDEAVQVARRGARALPWLRLLAWDLGLDEERGWVVFEANVHFGTVTLQSCTGGFLAGPLGEEAVARAEARRAR